MKQDFLERDVYCIGGLPFDAVNMQQAISRLREAASNRMPCFLSTPNLNFLIGCQRDTAFRDSVIHSDLNVVDGMPLIWMARLLGIPIYERVAGANLFEALDQGEYAGDKLKVYFFGGPEGVAASACAVLDSRDSGLECVGFHSPGFVSVAEMSEQSRIDAINASEADFVVVALGARKGQEWIERNRARINAPIISHLGAVVNFVAGKVVRAPELIQRAGLEWFWRILQEPELWRRYWFDGLAFISLLFGRVLPYALWLRFNRNQFENQFEVTVSLESKFCRISIKGGIDGSAPQTLRNAMHAASESGRMVLIDLAESVYLGPGFFGLLLVMKKKMDTLGLTMQIVNPSPQVMRLFHWNGVIFLL